MSQPPSRSSGAMPLRDAATRVVRVLQSAGHEAVFAGGCVRDMVMRRRPSDYDVATAATPRQVLSLFRRTQKVGAKFGVVLVRLGGHSIEVATFRRDLQYADGRHPVAVQFTDAREDALRRDFTINGMFYDPISRQVVDHVGGRADIRRRIIRAIGEPARRFAEDHLRMLRAIRFAARLRFKIDRATWSAIKAHAPDIAKISSERIREELDMILTDAARGQSFEMLRDSGLLEHLWHGAGRLTAHADRTSSFLNALPARASFEPAFAALLHRFSPAEVVAACDALRCSNFTQRTVAWLVARLEDVLTPDDLSLADLKMLMSHPAFGDLLVLCGARLKAYGLPTSAYRKLSRRAKVIRPQDVAPPPLLTGHDLERLGVKAGPIYKKILDRVYYAQLDGQVSNKSAALAHARQLLEEG